ncbi:hypothetical protein HMPREF1363_02821 [Enterococcus faecium ERV161]|nr:hypothetical protein HMPREF1363_02821 [Enterococcus faecium ERV161]
MLSCRTLTEITSLPSLTGAFLFFVFSIITIYRPKVQNENQFITSIADN